MLKEAMLALRVTDIEYAPEICRLLKSGEKDLAMAGVTYEGACVFVISEDQQTGAITVTDNSTITDDAVKTALITYTRANFGSPPDYDKLAASYDLQRRQLANATGYTDFLEPAGNTSSGADAPPDPTQAALWPAPTQGEGLTEGETT